MAQTTGFKPVTDEVLANPDPADWLMMSRTLDQHRYSPLNQINKGNVGQLRMAWTRACRPARRNPRRSSIAASCT